MWLINTTSLELESFTASDVPQYAILSHTWGDEEVSFQEINDMEKARMKSGFSKIKKTCQLARDSGIKYAWVDTCCIDKSSSAELSESINSMYNWYRQSRICYAYISDWPPEVDWANLRPLDDDDAEIEDSTSDKSSAVRLEKSNQAERLDNSPESTCSSSDSNNSMPLLRWFTRSWTLQELIAPTTMEFYDQIWNLKGLKSDPVVIENLSRITGVPPYILEDGSDGRLREICLGQRMSWAAHREASRVEDTAYCLLGIFQVNMPMIYGEGDRAFLRLQEEIIKFSTDLSMFAWRQHHQDEREYRGILSCHPREFTGLRDCRLLKSQFSQVEEVAMTNKGLRIHTSLFYPWHRDTLLNGLGVHFMFLGCVASGRHQGIILKSMEDVVYVRAEPNGLMEISEPLRRGEARTIYIARDWDQYANHEYAAAVATGIKIQLVDTKPYMFEHLESWPPGYYDQISSAFLVRDLTQFLGFLKLAIFDEKPLAQARRSVTDFIAVYCSIDRDVSVRLLEGERAVSFANYTKSIWHMDPITAQHSLFAYFISLRKYSRSDIVLQDSCTDAWLRVSANTDVCRRPAADGWPKIAQNIIMINLEVGELPLDR